MPRRLLFLLLTLASCVALGSRPAAQTARRPMTLVDLLTIPRVGDPQLSRDGSRITFALVTTDWTGNRRIPQIWLINSDGTQLRRLTSSENGAANARWSPDGSTIAYLSRGSVFVMASAGGEPRQVSKRTGASDIAWHPDGASNYFLAADPPSDAERERQRLRGDIRVLDEAPKRHLWKMAVSDGTEARVTKGNDHIFAYRISTRGDRIIISRRPSALAADSDGLEIWNIAADGSDPAQVTRNTIPEWDGELSPDGSQVLFIARANVFLAPPAGGRARALLPDLPYEVFQAGWSADGKSIWMLLNMGVRSLLVQVDLASREVRHITTGDHAVVPLSWSTVDGRHVFMIDERERIGDVWTWAPGGSSPKRVTGVYDYLDRTFALPRQDRVEWKGVDGVAVEGILTYPIEYKPGSRYPLVVQMHGGPEASDRFGWGSIFFYYQPAWAARGYAILRPNYRGSSGYGNKSYREPVGVYFKNSHLDVLAGVDRVVAMGGRSGPPGDDGLERRRSSCEQADHVHHALQGGVIRCRRRQLDLPLRCVGHPIGSRPLARGHPLAEERAHRDVLGALSAEVRHEGAHAHAVPDRRKRFPGADVAGDGTQPRTEGTGRAERGAHRAERGARLDPAAPSAPQDERRDGVDREIHPQTPLCTGGSSRRKRLDDPPHSLDWRRKAI